MNNALGHRTGFNTDDGNQANETTVASQDSQSATRQDVDEFEQGMLLGRPTAESEIEGEPPNVHQIFFGDVGSDLSGSDQFPASV